MSITVVYNGRIYELDKPPQIENDTLFFDGAWREIRQTHETNKGIQYELQD